MPTFTKFKQKDIDGRWFEFDHQQMGNSCGPASAKIAKQLYLNVIVGEEFLRGVGTLSTWGALNQEHSALGATNVAAKDWETSATNKDVMLAMLKSNPHAVSTVRQATGDYVAHLRKTTRTKPTVIGWLWATGGGHFNVCVGPTRSDPSLLTILDPALGVQYLNLDDRVGKAFYYRPTVSGSVHGTTAASLVGRFSARDFEPFLITYSD